MDSGDKSINSTNKMNNGHAGANGCVVPSNGVVQPLLTDLYQITMAYAYWKNGKMNDHAVFDLFFRKNPFRGEYAIFAGLEECVKFLANFKFSHSDIEYLRSVLPGPIEEEFFTYLSAIDASQVSLWAIPEGYVVFPKIPLVRIEGPLPVVQLMETTLLNLINYASLVATNASRFRMVVGDDIQLLEFGLRRAQGPDGGLSASKYCFMGGFDGTSNVLAGKTFGIPVRGTHAHAFVNSFQSLKEIPRQILLPNPESSSTKKTSTDFVELCLKYLREIAADLGIIADETNKGELAAFIAYAIAFPKLLLCLLDTYNVLRSGLPNFIAVSLALNEIGYKSVGVRLDSGDLAYLSVKCREAFVKISERFNLPWFKNMNIVASNDINEDTLRSLKEQGHEINSFGIGTHLVTCQKQPALGCVFKLVEVNDEPRLKLSEEVAKINIPGRKEIYRLYTNDGTAIVDLVQHAKEDPPKVNERILVRHPFIESKRAYVCPHRVEKLLTQYWGRDGPMKPFEDLKDLRTRAMQCLNTLRPDIKRELNPTPYKVSVSDNMYSYLHDLWLKNAPIGELA
uniref:nicotinate phosphoribosyltransferase-like n=1 Tax=Styela clava TaxID=7725 RepID=UPI0019395B39|nr:nicotinate phosphoribosyltransferase-like [Styela clava]